MCYPVTSTAGDPYFLLRCQACRVFFLAPRPDPGQLARAYGEDYYGEHAEKFRPSWIERTLDLFRQGRARDVARQIPAGGRILDVGCGNGKFLDFLGRYGSYERYGTELAGNSARRVSRIPGIHLKVGRLAEAGFPPGFFDAVTLFHVFEHLPDPAATLTLIDQILKPGGLLVFSFPNVTSLQSRLFKGDWLHLDPPRHLFFFDPDDFIQLMRQRGYRCTGRRDLSLEQNPFGLVQSLLNRSTAKREILFESFKGNRNYLAGYSRFKLFSQKVFFVFAMPIAVLADLLSPVCRNGATVQLTFRKNAE